MRGKMAYRLFLKVSIVFMSVPCLAMHHGEGFPPFFERSVVDRFAAEIRQKAAQVDLHDKTAEALLSDAEAKKAQDPARAELLFCAAIQKGAKPEVLGCFYKEQHQYEKAAIAFDWCHSPIALQHLGDIYAENILNENRASRAYLKSACLGNSTAYGSFARLFQNKFNQFRELPLGKRLFNNAIAGFSLAMLSGVHSSCCCLVDWLLSFHNYNDVIDSSLYEYILTYHRDYCPQKHGDRASESTNHTRSEKFIDEQCSVVIAWNRSLGIKPYQQESFGELHNRVINNMHLADSYCSDAEYGAKQGNPEALFRVASDVWMLREPHDDHQLIDYYVRAWQKADQPLLAKIKENVRSLLNSFKRHFICDLLLHALTVHENAIATEIMELMGTRKWFIYPLCAHYLLDQARERFAPFIYEQWNPVAVELLMRIIETSNKCCRRLPLTAWCHEYNLEEQPVEKISINAPFPPFSPRWFHLQKIRLKTYCDAKKHGIDTDKRLIDFAHSAGISCYETGRHAEAAEFLSPAASLNDQEAQLYMTSLCLGNPHFIGLDQAWMLPLLNKVILRKDDHVDVVRLYLLMSQGADEREEAFNLFCLLLADNEKEAVFAAQNWSSSLAEHIEQLAEHNDRAAIKLYALRSLLLKNNIEEAYCLIRTISERSDAWLTYVYLALAELQPELPDCLPSVILGYYMLSMSDEPWVRYQAENALKRYADEKNPLAEQVLKRIAYQEQDPREFLQMVKLLSYDNIRKHFFEWYSDLIVQKMLMGTDYPSCAAEQCYADALRLSVGQGWSAMHDYCEECRENGDYYADAADDRRAVPFLARAAEENDARSQERLAEICMREPSFITPAMHYLRPIVATAVTRGEAKAWLVHWYLLLCGTPYDREVAFNQLCARLAEHQDIVVLSAMPPAVNKLFEQLIQDSDCYALLIKALFALQHNDIHAMPHQVMKLSADLSPWVCYIQGRLAELQAEQDPSVIEHRQRYGTLLHCGNEYLASQAVEGLMRCAKRGDVVAYALLFCDRCETADKKAVVNVFFGADHQKLLGYFLQHGFERLVHAADRNAFAAYVLAILYEQQIAALDEQLVPQKEEYMRLALEAFKKSEKQGHSCAVKIAPLALYLAAHYRANNKLKEVDEFEQSAYGLCSSEDIKKALTQLLTSKKLATEHLPYFMEYMERLARNDGAVAYELATWYNDGTQFPSGCHLSVDQHKALHYAALASANNHADGKILHAKLMLVQPTSSAEDQQRALKFLKKQKNNDPALLKIEQEMHARGEQQQYAEDLASVCACKLDDPLLSISLDRLEKKAKEGDEQAMRAVGSALMNIADHKKKPHELVKRAYPLLDRYLANHPEDYDINKLLIRALFYSSKNDRNCCQRACTLIKLLEKNPAGTFEDADYERYGILFYRNQEYIDALSWFRRGSFTKRAAWYSALSFFHCPKLIENHPQEFTTYLGLALVVGEKSIMLSAEQLEDGDFASDWLLKWSDPRALTLLARLSLVGKKNQALVKYIGDKKAFGLRLLEAAAHDHAAIGLVLFAFRNNLWGLAAVPVLNTAIDYAVVALQDPTINVAARHEIMTQGDLLSRSFLSEHRRELVEERVPALIKACCATASTKIIGEDVDKQIEGLLLLMALKEYIFLSSNIKQLHPLFIDAYPFDALAAAAGKHNRYALLALIYALSLGLLNNKQVEQMKELIDLFAHKVLAVQDNELTGIVPQAYDLAARVLAMFGVSIRKQGHQVEAYMPFFMRALMFNGHDTEALWGLSWTLINYGPTAAEAQNGLILLEQLVQESPSAANCFSLAMLYMRGSYNGKDWIKQDHAKGLLCMEKAAKLGHSVAGKILNGIHNLQDHPVACGPLPKRGDQYWRDYVENFKHAYALCANNDSQKALSLFEELMKKCLDCQSAICAARICIDINHDYARAAYCILQLIECIKATKSSDPDFVREADELLSDMQGAGSESEEALFWWVFVDAVWRTFQEQYSVTVT